MSKNLTWVYGSLVLAQVLFGLNFIAGKHVLTSLQPYEFSCARFLLSGLILFLGLRAWGVKLPIFKASQWFFLCVAALFGITLSQTLFLSGLQQTTAINTSILAATIPLFALLTALLRQQVSLQKKVVFGFLLSLAGVIVIKGGQLQINSQSIRGDLLVLLGCALSGIYISYSKDIFQFVTPLMGTSLLFITGGAALVPVTYFLEGQLNWSRSFDTLTIISFLFSSLGATLLAYLISNWAVTRVDPARVSSFIFIQPIVAAIAAVLLLGESYDWYQFIGMFLILWGLKLGLKTKPVMK